MSFDATNFVKSRTSHSALIDGRVKSIHSYIIDCYYKALVDGKQYDYSKRGKISKENYLRNGLVDDYLRRHIQTLNSSTEEYTIINRESTETYTNVNDGLVHDDPIDIHIVDRALQNAWNSSSQAYYAIECKRINKLSDSSTYINDIKKFTERDYKNNRLPYEGQIAFIENVLITHKMVSDEINKILETASISTKSPLKSVKLYSSFDGSYISSHTKSFGENPVFVINHLFFDYSALIK